MVDVIRKRDGRLERFESAKIYAAVSKCLMEGLAYEPGLSGSISESVSRSVMNILSRENQEISVEHVQDIVIQQLWAAGLFDAATAYTIYREERKAQRETQVPTEIKQLFDTNKQWFPEPRQEFQYFDKYSRFDWDKGRREVWEETVARVVGFLYKQTNGGGLSREEWVELEQRILRMDVMPSMRIMQMAGPALERCHVGAYNCSYLPLNSIDSFAELLYISMQGTGVGFSVEEEWVSELPRIKKQKPNAARPTIVVPDSTEGWADSLKLQLNHLWEGENPFIDTSLVRPANAILRTKGGKASGPAPLRNLLSFCHKVVTNKQGRWLEPFDAHRIACMEGEIVHLGGVRRAALLSASDFWDREIREAKNGAFWSDPDRAMLRMANNSAVYLRKPTQTEFIEEWLSMLKGGNGERGILNRAGIYKQMPNRRKGHGMDPYRAPRYLWFGTNPCGEIVLRPHQFCNLSIAVCRPDDTAEELIEKVKWATILGTLQSTLTKFNYLRDIWRQNCEEERLLGVDLMGVLECKLLAPGTPGRRELLTKMRDHCVQVNAQHAAKIEINASAAITCGKPAGNSGEHIGVEGMNKPRHSKYYIRRYRVKASNPTAKVMMSAGVPWHPEINDDPKDPTIVVLELPVKSPEGAVVRDDMSALDQLNHWLDMKECWCEHNPSATIYIRPEEEIPVLDWVYKHFDKIAGLSFLPYDGGHYQLAPFEEIDQKEYEERLSKIPNIDWSVLTLIEKEDLTEISRDVACSAGGCLI